MILSVLTALALLVVLMAVVLSPLLFVVVAGRTSRWQELADVGDAYGGVAAVLSGLALVGIALSLLLQWRQSRSSLTLALRQHHFELVRLSIEQPSLHNGDVESESLRRRYANLWVAHWAMLWDLRQCDEDYLRQVAEEFFADEQVRSWWRSSGPTWSAKPTRRRRRFFEILMTECVRAVQAAASRVDAASPSQQSSGSAEEGSADGAQHSS